MMRNIPWQQIDTLLLDMDGTLLDLAFDSDFWQRQVPQALSHTRHISLDEAQRFIDNEYASAQHTLNWYCLDYWQQKLGLDIYGMLEEQGPQARLRVDTLPFLAALKAEGKRLILLTNAHPHNLAIKLKHTDLAPHLDLLLSTHTFGYPKEDKRLWQAVASYTALDSQRTLFIDDSEAILDAAADFGIAYCLGVANPDSRQGEKIFKRYPAVSDYRTLIPALSQQEA